MELKFVMMVGLPGSGKSTIAEGLAKKYNATILSSDKYREKLLGNEEDQTNNQLVFMTLYKDMRELLKSGNSVVYDATNMSMKDRSFALGNISTIKCDKIAYVVNEDVSVCKERNSTRDRKVPDFVYDKMLSKFVFPHTLEGFTSVVLHKRSDEFGTERKDILGVMEQFNQKSKYHKYLLGEHCRRVNEILSDCGIDLQEAAIWHDVGKLFTQTFDEDGYAHFYGHAGYSAYYLASRPWLVDKGADFDEVLFYVSQHMHIRDIMTSEKACKRYLDIFGEKRFNNLKKFMDADDIACK